FHKLIEGNISAQVVDGKSSHIEHHLDEVLTDIVNVTFNRTYYHCSLKSYVHLLAMRLQYIEACIERIRAHQYFGNEIFLGLKEPSYLFHSGNKAVKNSLVWVYACIQGFLCSFF